MTEFVTRVPLGAADWLHARARTAAALRPVPENIAQAGYRHVTGQPV